MNAKTAVIHLWEHVQAGGLYIFVFQADDKSSRQHRCRPVGYSAQCLSRAVSIDLESYLEGGNIG